MSSKQVPTACAYTKIAANIKKQQLTEGPDSKILMSQGSACRAFYLPELAAAVRSLKHPSANCHELLATPTAKLNRDLTSSRCTTAQAVQGPSPGIWARWTQGHVLLFRMGLEFVGGCVVQMLALVGCILQGLHKHILHKTPSGTGLQRQLCRVLMALSGVTV